MTSEEIIYKVGIISSCIRKVLSLFIISSKQGFSRSKLMISPKELNLLKFII